GIHRVPTALPEEVEPELTRFLYLPVVQGDGETEQAGSAVLVPEAVMEEEKTPVIPAMPELPSQSREPASQVEIETSAP
ncbi:MAG: hypothetical protein ACKO9F_07850, partial [Caldilinea sp.]